MMVSPEYQLKKDLRDAGRAALVVAVVVILMVLGHIIFDAWAKRNCRPRGAPGIWQGQRVEVHARSTGRLSTGTIPIAHICWEEGKDDWHDLWVPASEITMLVEKP